MMNFRSVRVVGLTAFSALIAACSGTKDTSSHGAAAVVGSEPITLSAVTTGVGDSFSGTATLESDDDDGTSYTRSYAVSLTYVDSSGYMADSSGNEPSSITMWVSELAAGSSDGSGTVSLQLQSDGKSFATSAPFISMISGTRGGQAASPVMVAFLGANNNWDSNSGGNYSLGLPLD